MWILLVPLIVAEVLFWVGLLYLGWCAFNAARRQNWSKTVLLLALMSAPFVFYFGQHIAADAKEQARIEEVAGFERVAMPADYPRQLDIHGFVTEFELLIYLDVLNIDQVAMFQSRSHRGKLRGQFITLVPECKGIGASHLETWKRKGRFGSASKQDKACLVSHWSSVDPDRSDIAALVFMRGSHTTLRQPGTNWADGSFEARLRTAAGDRLIDYWERPYITRPAEPGPWGYAYPANTDWKKYRAPKRLDFFLKAVDVL
jgi:hypothetical protein